MLADVTLPDGSVAVICTVVGTLWTALVYMWRTDLRRSAEITADLREQRDALLRVLYRLDLADQIPTRIPHSALPPPPPPGRRRSPPSPPDEESP